MELVLTKKNLNIGVPQGSILGPLLFLIYINDLPNASKFMPILFADDTTLSMSHGNYASLVEITNCELVKINDWLVINRLSLNIDKTFMMVFSNRRHDIDNQLPVVFDGNNVRLSETGKFLGVCLDQQLDFKGHITHICTKISKTIGIFL